MPANSVRVRASVSFKGETQQLETILDLDRIGCEPGEIPNFHQHLASACGIDPYSYLYEAIESHDLDFSDPTGAAVQACRDGAFDWAWFEQARREELDWQSVNAIAASLLSVDELDARPELKTLMLAVYRAGRASAG